jgi:arabinogalactan oligomer/maltooligosaccharide transport system permease protein
MTDPVGGASSTATKGGGAFDPKRSLGDIGLGIWVRIIGLALVDAAAVYAAIVLMGEESWGFLAALVVGTLFINWVYLWPRANALRWLTPGLVMMALFVIFPIVYTLYVSITNWKTGNILPKNQAVEQIESIRYTDPDDPGVNYQFFVFRDADEELRFWLRTDEGRVIFGEPRDRTAEPLEDPLDDPEELGSTDTDGDGIPETVGDFSRLIGPPLFALGQQLQDLILDLPGEGQVVVSTLTQAKLLIAAQRFVYDDATDTLTDTISGAMCTSGAGDLVGQFVCDDVPFDALDALFASRYDETAAGTLVESGSGSECTGPADALVCTGVPVSGIVPTATGWRTIIGLENFTDILSNERIREPFLGVFVWNFVFAGMSVVLTLALGLLLSIALQDDRVRGKAIYRSIYILPYAIPGFISILVWRGLLNADLGQVNQLLDALTFGNADGLAKIISFGQADSANWLGNGTLAKMAILLVNTWLGFPYMFLITSGALQAIPVELQEAARVDGASGPTVFRKITFPLLMVAISPLLIGSFAFNFNNFILIFMLTNGGPPITDAAVPVGETDLLISFTYDLALQSGRGQNFALGAAVTMIIFVIVALISAFSFRFTKRLEDVYGSL